MTLLFENDTRHITHKIAKRGLISNKRSSIIIIITIVLTQIFIASILSISFSYYKSLEKIQKLIYGRAPDLSTSTSTSILGNLCIIFFILIAAYLLIYNILYFSIIKDIQFYGQIKTIGGTKKQLRNIFLHQSAVISNIGIIIGIILFSFINYFIIPYVILHLMGERTSQLTKVLEVSFSPIIYILSIILIKFITYFSFRSIIKFAANLSPVEALKYSNNSLNKTNKTYKIKGMPYRNVFRNRRGTIITFLSLCIGICSFWISIGLSNTMDMKNLAFMYMKNENIIISVKNPSARSGLDKLFLQDISAIPGVNQVRELSYLSLDSKIQIRTNDSFKEYLNYLYRETPQYQESEKTFRKGKLWMTELYGIGREDFETIAAQLSVSIDPVLFEKGKMAIFCMNDLEMDTSSITFGEKVEVVAGENKYIFDTPTKGISYKAISDNDTVSPHYNAPAIIVSNNALEKIASEIGGTMRRFQVKIHTDAKNENAVLQSIRELTKNYKNIAVQSRLEKEKELKTSFEFGKTLLIILSGILFAIGLINYINTLSINISNRSIEFALLECVGMTKRQIVKMLHKEAMIYCGITAFLCIIGGTAVYQVVYYYFQKIVPYTHYQYPIINLGIVLTIMLLISMIVPNRIYLFVCKKSIIERIKVAE